MGLNDPTTYLQQIYSEYFDSLSIFFSDIVRYSYAAANGLIYKLRLRQADYQELRNGAVERGAANLYPGYTSCFNYRKKYCLPNNIQFGPDYAMVGIQDVLNHQMHRRLDVNTIQQLKELKALDYEFKLYFKFGCDSASGYSNYR